MKPYIIPYSSHASAKDKPLLFKAGSDSRAFGDVTFKYF
jgi:hypothetical protein